MKKPILIITLGARDVQIAKTSGKRLFGKDITPSYDQKGFFLPRPGSKFLLQQFKELYPHNQRGQDLIKELELPILKPALNFLKEEKMLMTVEHLLFIVTDQDEHVKEHFRARDTINSAKLLEHILPILYPGFADVTFSVFSITEDVNSTEKLNPLFAAFVRRDLRTYDPDSTQVILLNQGGIDAINQSLLLATLNKYGDEIYLLSVSEEDETCYNSNFPGIYQRERSVFQAKGFIISYNYAALKGLEGLPEDAIRLAKVLDARLGFDFERARHEAGKIRKTSVKRKVIHTLDHISQPENRLVELYRNARIKLKNENYVDFLLRAYRIAEDLSRERVSAFTGFSTNVGSYVWKKEMQERKDSGQFAELFATTSEQKLKNGFQLDICYSGVPSFLAIWSFYEPKVADKFHPFLALTEIRNRSIAAHDFDPVSRTIIDEALKEEGTDLDTFIKELDNEFLKIDDVHSFSEANKLLVSLIESD